ncbi:MAG: hypothetical protein V2I79_05685 [Xanthomonadales bacterium]|jgi:hypothetical protein|nr:hypothetical protein [Xanthomonadales bacterium]
MKKAILAIAFLVAPALSMADDHTAVVEFWKCELNDGVKMEDVEATNDKWLALTRKTAGTEDVNSYVLTAVVGSQETFMFVDAYPDMVAWAKAKDAESEESEAIDAMFAEQMECEENRLYKSKRQ